MLNCPKVAGSDSTCYRLNVKVTAAEPSPVVEEGKLPPSTSSRAAHGTAVRQSRKKLSFVNDETRPHGEHSHQVTTASSPLESYVSSQQEVLKHYHRDLEEFKRREQNVPAEINPSQSATVDEQAMSINPAVQEASALNLETLASAVSLLEKLPLQ